VVFNFISQEVASQIFEIQLNRIISMVHRQQGVRIGLSSAAWDTLHAAATAPAVLEFGGRGIGSLLERAFVNPLARELFMMGSGPGEELTVTEVRSENGQWGLLLQSAHPDDRIASGSPGIS